MTPPTSYRMLLAVVVAAAGLAAGAPLRADDIKDARAAFQAGRYDEAMQKFERAAGQGLAEGRAGVGQVLLRRRQYDKAMDAFKTAQKMDPNLALAYYGEGEVMRLREQCDQAIPILRKAVELDRKFPEAQLALGNCLIVTKQHEQAVEVLTQGTRWGSKWRPRFLVALGDAELARDSLRDAGIYYTRARQESPDDPSPRRALGDFYSKRGTFELAVPEYQAAIDADSTDVELRFALGRALFYAERYNDALQEYRKVVEMDPEFAPGQFALGDLYYRSGQADRRRYLDAKEPLEKYTKLRPQDAKGWGLLGRTYYHTGMREEAHAAMAKAEQMGDTSKELYNFLARVSIDRKQWDQALAYYEKGSPESEDQLRIAQLFVIQNQPARAESLYSAIAADSATSSGRFALLELAKVKFRQKDYPASNAILQRLIALDPSKGEAYYYMGLSHKEMKDYPASLSALRKAAELDPEKADRHFWVGILYAQVDSSGPARRAFQRSVELDSAGTNKNTAVALRQLGFYELLGKEYSSAIRMLERSVQINAQDALAWVWLGQGYQNSGNRAKACEAYDRALAIDPNQRDAIKGKQSLGC